MNFDWSKMKKEQKQAVLLVGMWLLGGLFALYQFVLVPFMKDRGKSVGELDKLQNQILKAQIAMDGEAKIRHEFQDTTEQIQRVTNEHIVPMGNPLTWVTERVYNSARMVGVDIQSVGEIKQKTPMWEALIKADRVFKPYTVRIVMECGYSELLAMISALELSNPYVTVTGVIVTAQDQFPTRHLISLVVEWPIWGKNVNFEVAKLTQ